jgi:LEA14-like dessication related protein
MAMVGCATPTALDSVQVNVVGLDALPNEGMELRMGVKLRIQNPRDTAIDFDGVALNLELRDQDFATGVTPVRGTVPRFGETVVTVPVTVSATAMLRQAWSLANGGLGGDTSPSFRYVARGKLGGSAFGASRFESRGELQLPSLNTSK